MGSVGPFDFTVCIGGGNFGTRAATTSKLHGAVTLVIDPRQNCAASAVATRTIKRLDEIDFGLGGVVQYLQGDGLDIIADVVAHRCPDIVVPASPGHLMAKAAIRLLSRRTLGAIPWGGGCDRMADRLDDDIILIADRDDGIIVTSFMDEGTMCMDVCPQPELCPVTGRTHPAPMYKLVDDAMASSCGEAFLMRSFLLSDTAGVGGIEGSDVKAFLGVMRSMKEGTRFAVATSCSCHAVINAMEVTALGDGRSTAPLQ
ncbi:hypothetical protein EF808_01200 [archaeon]|nr:MAG: hypothetical protein EF808_01200 [archaeon]